MTLGQFMACVDGWNRTHGPADKPEAPSDDEFEEIKKKMGDA